MSDRHLAPISQWPEPQSGARVAQTLYIIENPPGSGTYSPDDTGPADGYQSLTGGGDYDVSTTATKHDGFARIINGVAVSR